MALLVGIEIAADPRFGNLPVGVDASASAVTPGQQQDRLLRFRQAVIEGLDDAFSRAFEGWYGL